MLLLDEPTNHLDAETIAWLQQHLIDYKGTILVVTHDRYFLDDITGWILELDRGRGIPYEGNYSAWLEQKAKRLEQEAREDKSKQKTLERELEWMRQSPKARQAKSKARINSYNELANQSEREKLSRAQIIIPNGPRLGNKVIEVKGLKKAMGDKLLVEGLDFSLPPGGIVGVIGPNGAGKTTLVRCLLGETDPDAGSVTLGSKLAVGYFRQSHEAIDPDLTVVRYLQKIVRDECPGQLLSEQVARNLAGAFLFSGEAQEKELGFLSGGERARAALAGLMASAKNVLVLDEPTNHLDIPSAERLEDALRKPREDEKDGSLFEGTLILISHDRALLDACCDQLLILDGHGGVRAFAGTYSEWHAKQEAAKGDRTKAKSPERERRAERATPAESPSRTRNAQPAETPKKSKWSWMRIEQLEEKIAFLEGRLGEIDRELNDPDVWKDIDRANKLTDERDEHKAELEGVEAEWLRKAE